MMIATECSEILCSCIARLCVGGKRCESSCPGRQCARLQKGATAEEFFSVFHGLLLRDEERRLYSMRHGENIRALRLRKYRQKCCVKTREGERKKSRRERGGFSPALTAFAGLLSG